MTSRRMISSDVFEDEFYISLNMFGRNLWFGLIVKCADDQGRFQDNSILIKSQVFPADEVTPDEVEAVLSICASESRVLRYVSNGKKIIQILNWWKHQTPQWASPSRYPAPDGWIDREKYHAPGNKIITNNWDKRGGYEVTNTVTNPNTNLVSKRINEGDGEVNGEGDGEVPPPPIEDIPDGDLAPFEQVFLEETKLPILSGGPERWFEGLKKIKDAGATTEDFRAAIREQTAAANGGKRYNLTSPASFVNAVLNIVARRNAKEPAKPKQITAADLGYTRASLGAT